MTQEELEKAQEELEKALDEAHKSMVIVAIGLTLLIALLLAGAAWR